MRDCCYDAMGLGPHTHECAGADDAPEGYGSWEAYWASVERAARGIDHGATGEASEAPTVAPDAPIRIDWTLACETRHGRPHWVTVPVQVYPTRAARGALHWGVVHNDSRHSGRPDDVGIYLRYARAWCTGDTYQPTLPPDEQHRRRCLRAFRRQWGRINAALAADGRSRACRKRLRAHLRGLAAAGRWSAAPWEVAPSVTE